MARQEQVATEPTEKDGARFAPEEVEDELVVQSRASLSPWTERLDPFYRVTWHNTAFARWTSVSVLKQSLKPDGAGTLRWVSELLDSPVDQPDFQLYRLNAIRIVAFLNQFHQATTTQLACLLGVVPGKAFGVISSLYAAGVVSRWVPPWAEEEPDPMVNGSGSVWTLNRKSWTFEEWLDGLEDIEWALLTSGDDPTYTTVGGGTSPHNIRHNLLATELLLRCMEQCPGVAGAWGEGVTDVEVLTGDFPEVGETERQSIGDGAVVGKDGRIVVIELNGASNLTSVGNGGRIAEKAASWVGAIAKATKAGIDLRVVFVDCASKPRPHNFRWWVHLGSTEKSSAYVASRPLRTSSAEKVYAVDVRDWFPMDSATSLAFLDLEAWNPMTKSYSSVVPADLSYGKPGDPPVDLVTNTVASLHIPEWIVRNPVPLGDL